MSIHLTESTATWTAGSIVLRYANTNYARIKMENTNNKIATFARNETTIHVKIAFHIVLFFYLQYFVDLVVCCCCCLQKSTLENRIITKRVKNKKTIIVFGRYLAVYTTTNR